MTDRPDPLAALRAVRATRWFTGEDVDDGTLREILDAAPARRLRDPDRAARPRHAVDVRVASRPAGIAVRGGGRLRG
ncbi:hypothetical protein [Actinomadura sediminis]|uniref:Nitroreductase n=1 Tax=Actinomadura sediminis TaxID=1038904 RepID=A0ABW3EHE2_9ACTN